MHKTRQELFDNAVSQMKKQDWKQSHGIFMRMGKKPGEGVLCLYRDFKNNRKCAIGANIPDEKYQRRMEGRNARSINVRAAAGIRAKDLEFADKLQSAHDHSYTPKDMRLSFKSLAERYDLKFNP